MPKIECVETFVDNSDVALFYTFITSPEIRVHVEIDYREQVESLDLNLTYDAKQSFISHGLALHDEYPEGVIILHKGTDTLPSMKQETAHLLKIDMTETLVAQTMHATSVAFLETLSPSCPTSTAN
jgi:DNA polymerase IIIc chi subunit